jgi:hypothetical protein
MIYPTNKKKYSGGIFKRTSGSYMVTIRTKEIKICKTFKTQELSFEFLKAKNIEHNLSIKNMIEDMGDHYKCELTQGKFMLFDKDDIDIVNEHTICCHNGYSESKVGDYRKRFHNILLNHTPNELTVDHINQNPLDNRRVNLRIVDKRTQCINQGKRCNNKSGTIGVHFQKSKNIWVSAWRDIDGKNRIKSFSVKKYPEDAKQLAIDYRKHIVSTLPHYQV